MNRGTLQQITLSAEHLTVFRHTYPPSVLPLDPLAGRPNSNRWGTPRGTLYTASSQTVAWAECCRYYWHEVDLAAPDFVSRPITSEELYRYGQLVLEEPAPLRSIYEIAIDFRALANLADKADQARLVMAGFPLSDFLSNSLDNYGLCPELASIGEDLGWEALQALSAALPNQGYTVAVFAAGQSRVERTTLIMTARPTIAMAAATRYRDGQCPSWVPP